MNKNDMKESLCNGHSILVSCVYNDGLSLDIPGITDITEILKRSL